jgi:hypothetical protein
MTDLSLRTWPPAAAFADVAKRAKAGVNEPRFHKKEMSTAGKKQSRRRGVKKLGKVQLT